MKNMYISTVERINFKLFIFILLISLNLWNNLLAQEYNGDYAEINGAKLWYKSTGTGEPLLLIPGGPGFSHLYFTPHFTKLSEKFKIIYFDALGRGKSERADSSSEYTLNRDVIDIEGLREFLGIDKLNIFGHSYGGIVAQAYALQYPEHVNKLILANTLFSAEMYQAMIDNLNNEIQNQHPEVWKKLKSIHDRDQRSNTFEYLVTISSVSMQLAYFYDASNSQRLVGDQNSFNPEVYFAFAGDNPGFTAGGELGDLDFSHELKKIKTPTLIVEGRFDRVCFPKYTLQYKIHMPQAKFIMFEKSGHFPHIEEPQTFFETLDAFLSNENE